MKGRDLDFSYWSAGASWVAWRDDFAASDLSDLPVLICSGRFDKFLQEYSLHRFLPEGKRPSVRDFFVALDADFTSVDDAAKGLEHKIADTFGEDNVPRLKDKNGKYFKHGRVSLVSKVLTLYNPEVFTPFDRFAKIGLRNVMFSNLDKKTKHYADYEQYSRDFDTAFEHYSEILRAYIDGKDTPASSLQYLAFQRRVFDTWLMVQGGRWSK